MKSTPLIIACLIIGIPFTIFLSKTFFPVNYLYFSAYKLIYLTPFLYRLIEKKPFITHHFKNISPQSFLIGLIFIALYISGYLLVQDNASDLTSTGLTSENILWIGLYIIFINSFLEEFFWRSFIFDKLRIWNRPAAYVISSLGFAAFHTAFSISFLNPITLILSTLGLILFAVFMNFYFEKYRNLTDLWVIHACADVVHIAIAFISLK